MTKKPTYEELEQKVKELEKEAADSKRAKEALRESEEKFKDLFNNAQVGLFRSRVSDGKILECNDRFAQLVGYNNREGCLAEFVASEHYVDPDVRNQMLAEMRATGEVRNFEAQFTRRDGSPFWMSYSARIYPKGDCVEGAAIDISDLKQAEGALRKEKEKFRILVEEAPLGVSLIGKDGNYRYINPKFFELFGYNLEDIPTGQEWFRKAYPDLEYRNQVISTWINDFRSAKIGESRPRIFNVKCKDGSEKVIHFRPVAIEAGEQFVFHEDITESKRAEEALRKSEQRYRTLLDFVPYPLVVSTLDGKVTYLNPSFTETFGWALEELEGNRIPYVPPEFQQETSENIKKLFEEKIVLRHETKRLTKDGRILDVIGRAAIVSESEGEPTGELVILRDITQEKRIARNNEAMLRISMALPQYPQLEELLDYISSEVVRLLGTEGGVVILLDEERQELFFPGVAYDDTATQKRVKEVRLPLEQMDQVVAGEGTRMGEPIIINDTSKVRKSYPIRDEKLGYETKSFLQVPLKSSDRIIGFLTAINKKEGIFDQSDIELLSMIAGTVALSIENARFSRELKKAYKEVTSLNRAKDKVINHLSHELKTPVSVLYGSLKILAKRLATLPEKSWMPAVERAERNLERLLDIQHQVDDIMQDKHYKTYDLLSLILDQCTDELESLIAEEVGEDPTIERVRKRVEEIFGPKEITPEEILLGEYVKDRIEELRPLFSHRKVEIISNLEAAPSIYMPLDPLQKVIDGLIKNAIENTPDEGKVEVLVRKKGEGAELVMHDYGVGITEEYQRRIFEGFFTTQDTAEYSSKRPFDFNAGGKGADLLRMKIFSERYNFRMDMDSSRCRFIPNERDICPGLINECGFCKKKEDCYRSGGSTFSVYFPQVSKQREKSH